MDRNNARAMAEGLEVFRGHEMVNIISAPFLKAADKCIEIAKQHPTCFNPDTDFGKIGVVPETGSAGWVNGWTKIAQIVGEKRGTAFFIRHPVYGLVGSQQEGELTIAKMAKCNIEFVDCEFDMFILKVWQFL